MRVLFDSQIFCHQRFGGISRYVTNVALEMWRNGYATPLIVAPVHFNQYAGELPKNLVHGRRVRWLEHAGPLAFGTGYIPGRIAARRFHPDVVHNTYYAPTNPVPGTPGIITVHDMIHERLPYDVSSAALIARWKERCISRASRVICISESTRHDLLNTYEIPEERISVIHLGHTALASSAIQGVATDVRDRAPTPPIPYILHVGDRARYKNFSALRDAYASSAWLRGNFALVCFGGGKFTPLEKLSIREAGLDNRVLHVSGDDAALANYYRHAAMFVCPSKYEGFGLPPLEAMSLDCPVACSNTSSLPEVVGNAAEMFDPTDTEAIRNALERVLSSNERRMDLVAKGRVQQLKFSWTECARKTAEVYRIALNV